MYPFISLLLYIVSVVLFTLVYINYNSFKNSFLLGLDDPFWNPAETTFRWHGTKIVGALAVLALMISISIEAPLFENGWLDFLVYVLCSFGGTILGRQLFWEEDV